MSTEISPPIKGDIIRYRYQHEWEYARWNGDGTRTLLGAEWPSWVERVVQGVWKKEQFLPRKVVIGK